VAKAAKMEIAGVMVLAAVETGAVVTAVALAAVAGMAAGEALAEALEVMEESYHYNEALK
jgi:hypothetical protein